MKVGIFADAHISGDHFSAVDSALERLSDCDMIVNLGDLMSYTGDRDTDRRRIEYLERAFKACPVPVCHVPGNHDFDTPRASLPDYIARSMNGQVILSAHWTHILLDSCYTPQGVSFADAPHVWNECLLPDAQLAFLSDELRRCENAIVYLHNPLALPEGSEGDISDYMPKNAMDVRQIIERSGVVRLVVHGHYHSGGHEVVGGIPYITQSSLEHDGKRHASVLTLEQRFARREPIEF